MIQDKQADMLSLDEDGDVEDHCKNDDIGSDCGHTHYQFKAVDDNGRYRGQRIGGDRMVISQKSSDAFEHYPVLCYRRGVVI